MSSSLDFLFDKYNVSPKDRYDIANLYRVLTDEKKSFFLENFSKLSTKIKKIEAEIEEEKKILIGDSVEKIRTEILKNRQK